MENQEREKDPLPCEDVPAERAYYAVSLALSLRKPTGKVAERISRYLGTLAKDVLHVSQERRTAIEHLVQDDAAKWLNRPKKAAAAIKGERKGEARGVVASPGADLALDETSPRLQRNEKLEIGVKLSPAVGKGDSGTTELPAHPAAPDRGRAEEPARVAAAAASGKAPILLRKDANRGPTTSGSGKRARSPTGHDRDVIGPRYKEPNPEDRPKKRGKKAIPAPGPGGRASASALDAQRIDFHAVSPVCSHEIPNMVPSFLPIPQGVSSMLFESNPDGIPPFLHHGSLPKSHRELDEDRFERPHSSQVFPQAFALAPEISPHIDDAIPPMSSHDPMFSGETEDGPAVSTPSQWEFLDLSNLNTSSFGENDGDSFLA